MSVLLSVCLRFPLSEGVRNLFFPFTIGSWQALKLEGTASSLMFLTFVVHLDHLGGSSKFGFPGSTPVQ